MKKDVLYIIAIIALILYLGYTIRGRRIEVRSLNTMIEVMNDTIEYSKNKEGEWEAEKRSHNLTVKELRRHGQEVGIANENLRKRIGSLNNLVAQLQGQIGVTGTGTVVFQRDTITIIEGDSSRVFLGHRFDWTNDYLSLEGTLDDTYRRKSVV